MVLTHFFVDDRQKILILIAHVNDYIFMDCLKIDTRINLKMHYQTIGILLTDFHVNFFLRGVF